MARIYAISTCIQHCTTDPPNGTLDERLYAEQDANWNATCLIDASGDAVERYIYKAYGTAIVMTGACVDRGASAYNWQYYLTGRRWDAESRIYHYRMRSYSAPFGRFLARDPLGFRDFEYNLYAFLASNPARNHDPSGLVAMNDDSKDDEDPCKCCKAAIGALTVDEITFRNINARRTCVAKLDCKEGTCERGMPASTGNPAVSGQQWLFEVCISCKVPKDNLEAVIQHELVHIKQFCFQGQGIQDCSDCLRREREAHTESCQKTFPTDGQKRKRCVACGVFYSCRHLKKANGQPCVRDEKPPCKFEDLGFEWEFPKQ